VAAFNSPGDILKHLSYLSNFNNEGYICPTLASKGPGGKHGLSEGFKRIMRRAGVDTQLSEGKGVRKFCKRTFHSLRHSFTSSLANAGVPEEIRMKLTGHTTRDIHTRYTHHEHESLKNAIDLLSLQ
jgi:integrase